MRPKTLAALKILAQVIPFPVGCWMLGHDDQQVNAPTKKGLRCGRCGRESEGWDIGGGWVWVRESDHPKAQLVKRPLTIRK